MLVETDFFGEASLRRAVAQFEAHFHEERPHQGKGNVILFSLSEENDVGGPIRCRERLGGLLKYYHREAGWYGRGLARAAVGRE